MVTIEKTCFFSAILFCIFEKWTFINVHFSLFQNRMAKKIKNSIKLIIHKTINLFLIYFIKYIRFRLTEMNPNII